MGTIHEFEIKLNPTPRFKHEIRTTLAAQFRLLALRVEHELPLDQRSLLNTLRLAATLEDALGSQNRGP